MIKRFEYYSSVLIVLGVLAWLIYILNSITATDLEKAQTSINKMETQIKVLESKTERDTIVININLDKK